MRVADVAAVIPLLENIIQEADRTKRLAGFLRLWASYPWFSGEDNQANARAALASIDENLPLLASKLRIDVRELLLETDARSLLTETGIPSNDGFLTETFRIIRHRWIPPLPQIHTLKDQLGLIFHAEAGRSWWEMQHGSEQLVLLINWLFPSGLPEDVLIHLRKSVFQSLDLLTLRLVTLSVEPVLLAQVSDWATNANPFHALRYSLRHCWEDEVVDLPEFDALKSLLERGQTMLSLLREKRFQQGTSVQLSNLIYRIECNLSRTKQLLELLNPNVPAGKAWHFFDTLLRMHHHRYRLRKHLNSNLGMLAFQITEHAGQTGEHYISHNKQEWWKMGVAAAKGGLIVGFLSVFKAFLHRLPLSLLGTASVYSLNYAFGFIAILLSGGTLATKQPAMTATHMASLLEESRGSEKQLQALSFLIVKLIRTQLIALAGNVLVAFPIAFLLGAAWMQWSGAPFLSQQEAEHMMHDLHPVKSLALLHAAIAGVWLFFSGLISGYYDNRLKYSQLQHRIVRLPILRGLSDARKVALSHYLEHHFGSLVGNAILGLMLGSTGIVGQIMGLPLDIRHVTFSAANLGLVLSGYGWVLTFNAVWPALAGFVGIGLVNLLVSFSLALTVAMRSRRVSFAERRKLLGLVWNHFKNHPFDFIYPSKKNEQ